MDNFEWGAGEVIDTNLYYIFIHYNVIRLLRLYNEIWVGTC